MKDFFQIYNLDFEPVSLPKDELGYGLRGLDVDISSTAEEVTESTIAGVPGSVVTGFRDSTRNMSLKVRLRARDATDYRLKRDVLYQFFKRLGTFYVTENQQGNKLMQVRVVDSYQPERPENNQTYASVEIPVKIIGPPYWISRFKSMDLHNAGGVPFNGRWSFGMGLDVDADKLKYEYTNQQQFNIYNAGTKALKTIQERGNCMITIRTTQNVNNFKLTDATGRSFEYNPEQKSNWSLSGEQRITLNGPLIESWSTPIIERTNFYYPVILPGDNEFTIEGMSQFTVTFDFRFKYD